MPDIMDRKWLWKNVSETNPVDKLTFLREKHKKRNYRRLQAGRFSIPLKRTKGKTKT